MDLNDIIVDQNVIDKDKLRFEYFVSNYLLKYLKGSQRTCSIGCGTGYDVEILNKKGFDAYGFDPGNRKNVWGKERDAETQNKLFVASTGDAVLKPLFNSFDYAYSLEVIEHVGTENGVWELKEDWFKERVKFMEDSLDLLKSDGKFLLSTSNRNCPIDIGHGHHYNPLTDFLAQKLGLRLTIPFHKKNFVCSFSDLANYLDNGKYKGKYSIKSLNTSNYLSNSSGRNLFLFNVFNLYLKFVNLSFTRTSFLNPILVVEIQKKV